MLLCVLGATVVFAKDPEVAALKRLQKQHEHQRVKLKAEYDKRVTRLDQQYLKELEKLKDRLVRADRLDEALVVKVEMNRLAAELQAKNTTARLPARRVTDAIVGRWYYEAENTTFSREFMKDAKFILRRAGTVQFTASYTVMDDGTVIARTGNGIEMRHALRKDGRLNVEGSYIAKKKD